MTDSPQSTPPPPEPRETPAESPRNDGNASRGARATRGPGSGDTSLAADVVQRQSGLPFGKLPVEFGRYRIEKLLGAGAMGAVYLATDSQLDRQVAIKVPKLSMSGSPALLGRMEREAKALAQLDHPNLCKIYDFNVIDGVRFIALEYVQGETLKSLLQRLGRKRKVSDAVAMTVQLARALGAAHEKGVVHRDLKPENVMRRPDGRLVIMDFGLNNRQSQLGEEAAHKTQQGTVLGTPAYMSPEQAAGRLEEVDRRSDIYALGVMLYEMLTGELPFSGTAVEIMGRKTVLPAPSPLSVNSKLPPELAAICERMLAQKPENRTATCAELVKALKACDLTAQAALPDPLWPQAPAAEETFSGNPFDFLRDTESSVPAEGAASIRRPPSPKSDSPLPVVPEPTRSSGRGLLARSASWWSSRPLSWRLSLSGGAAALAVLLGVIFLPTAHGTLQVDVDDPSLTVKIAGSTITVDNDGEPIRIRATAPETLEVLQNGVAVESASRQITVQRNEKRLLRVSLLNGRVAIDGAVSPAAVETDPKPEGEGRPAEVVMTEPARPVPVGRPAERSGDVSPTGLMAGERRTWTDLPIAFRWCPAGTFTMGSADSEETDEDPEEVTLSNGFWIQETEATQGTWRSVMNSTPWDGQTDIKSGDLYPASYIPQGDDGESKVADDSATQFCRKLTEREKAAGRLPEGWIYRLPTEAEWEYACRAGSGTRYGTGDEEADLIQSGWYQGNCFRENSAHPVGTKPANAWGLHDMHGNVFEWTCDWHSSSLPGGDDPRNENGSGVRAMRGGSFLSKASSCRSSFRGSDDPLAENIDDSILMAIGFRIVLARATAADLATPVPGRERFAEQVLPIGRTFEGEWNDSKNPGPFTIRVIESDGNNFRWEWRLHRLAFHWIFEGQIVAEVAGGFSFKGELTRELGDRAAIHRIIGANEAEGTISKDGSMLSATWRSPKANLMVKFQGTRVDRVLKDDIENGSFERRFEGWTVEGGAGDFRTFVQNDGKSAMTTHGGKRSGETTKGRIFQDILVPPDAVELTFKIHGGAAPITYVSLRQGETVIEKVSGKNSNRPFLVQWDLQPLRGQVVTLEVVDLRDTPPFGFVGVQEFAIRRAKTAN